MGHSTPELQKCLAEEARAQPVWFLYLTSKETNPETGTNSVIVRVEIEVTPQGCGMCRVCWKCCKN